MSEKYSYDGKSSFFASLFAEVLGGDGMEKLKGIVDACVVPNEYDICLKVNGIEVSALTALKYLERSYEGMITRAVEEVITCQFEDLMGDLERMRRAVCDRLTTDGIKR